MHPHIESALQMVPLLYAKSIQLIGEVRVSEYLRDKPILRPERSLVIIDGVDECATEQDQKLILALIAGVGTYQHPITYPNL